MNYDIPNIMVPLLLISWLAQIRLCRNMQGEDFVRERAVAKYGGMACLGGAAVVTVLNFFV